MTAQAPEKQEKQKVCAKCGSKRPLSSFGASTTSLDGKQSYCRDCRKQLQLKRRHTNVLVHLRHTMSTRMSKSVPNCPSDVYGKLTDYLGYSLAELKRKLNAELKASYQISLRKAIEEGWHLDHKQPLSSFDVTSIDDPEFRRCWSIDNLVMIPADVNLRKGARIIEDYAHV